jgi:hypothetical protein
MPNAVFHPLGAANLIKMVQVKSEGLKGEFVMDIAPVS